MPVRHRYLLSLGAGFPRVSFVGVRGAPALNRAREASLIPAAGGAMTARRELGFACFDARRVSPRASAVLDRDLARVAHHPLLGP
jgi:hypothetical protein